MPNSSHPTEVKVVNESSSPIPVLLDCYLQRRPFERLNNNFPIKFEPRQDVISIESILGTFKNVESNIYLKICIYTSETSKYEWDIPFELIKIDEGSSALKVNINFNSTIKIRPGFTVEIKSNISEGVLHICGYIENNHINV